MKTALSIFVWMVALCFVVWLIYLAVAYVNLELNPLSWGEWGRVFFGMFTPLFWILSFVIWFWITKDN